MIENSSKRIVGPIILTTLLFRTEEFVPDRFFTGILSLRIAVGWKLYTSTVGLSRLVY